MRLSRNELFLNVNDTANVRDDGITEVSTKAYHELSEYFLHTIAFGRFDDAENGDPCPMCHEGTLTKVPSTTRENTVDCRCVGGDPSCGRSCSITTCN